MESKCTIGKRSKEMDAQIHALRDRRIVDQEAQLGYLGTEEMAANVGTKPLARKKFEYFRDIIAMIRSSQMNTPFIVKESGKKKNKTHEEEGPKLKPKIMKRGRTSVKTKNHEEEGPQVVK